MTGYSRQRGRMLVLHDASQARNDSRRGLTVESPDRPRCLSLFKGFFHHAGPRCSEATQCALPDER